MKRKNILVLLGALLFLLLAGCEEGGASSQKAEETLCPVTLNGTEIRVGETTVQAVLDMGLDVTWTDENYQEVMVDPAQELEAESYYTGGSIWVSDSIFAFISFVTEEEPIPLGQAVIARLEFQMYGEEDPAVLGAIEFDGVPVTEFTRDKAGEMYPDWTGDENMWLKYGLEYSYDLNFDTDGKLVKFAVEKKYDVDWTGSGE